MSKKIELIKKSDYLYEIPKHGGMRVPGRIYADEQVLRELDKDESLQQVINVAHLPGIIKYSLAMPDIHWGYGFPIGGVAAMRIKDGVISPGGIGFDINCGVRLLKTDLTYKDIKDKLRQLIDGLFQFVPSGVGSKGNIKISKSEFKKLLKKGAEWAVSNGYGTQEDLEHIEDKGCIKEAEPEVVSAKAIERGLPQIGTLGSGNHFLEIEIVDEIYDEKIASKLGLEKEQVMVQIHTGSRGFGHQVCDDYIKVMNKALHKYGISVPDKQLCCAPIDSPEGKRYYQAMACAANYAFVNRQLIKYFTEQAFLSVLSITPKELNMQLIYDICHNIGKFEEHKVNGKTERVFVHRKGATRAFPPHHPSVPDDYKEIGQPVLIPGDMGRYSFLLVGREKAMEETFGSSCHGAGRVLSRHQALKKLKGVDLFKEIEENKGVLVAVKSKRTLGEEMPIAYKDVKYVVDVMDRSGVSKKVVRLRPLAVTKG